MSHTEMPSLPGLEISFDVASELHGSSPGGDVVRQFLSDELLPFGGPD
jgi:hypothetical protein